jgi:hypothetical protein
MQWTIHQQLKLEQDTKISHSVRLPGHLTFTVMESTLSTATQELLHLLALTKEVYMNKIIHKIEKPQHDGCKISIEVVEQTPFPKS